MWTTRQHNKFTKKPIKFVKLDSMNKLDQAKILLQVRKVQKQLKNQVLEIEGGNGAVVVEITGEQKIKKVHIDPDRVNLDNIEELERWLEEAMKEAVTQSQKVAAEKMKPFLGQLGNLGLWADCVGVK